MLKFAQAVRVTHRACLFNQAKWQVPSFSSFKMTNIEISTMINRQIEVPNSFMIMNIRELLLKNKNEVNYSA